MSLESTLQTALLLALPARLPDVRFFRRNVGAAKFGGATVRFAIKGQCDLYAVTRGGRRHLECELKAYGERLKPDQRAWQAWCKEWEIPHIVLTGGKDETVEETVDRWIGELAAILK